MKLLQFILPLAVGVVAQESPEDNVKGLRSMKKPSQLSKTLTSDKKESLRKMRKARRSSDNGHGFILDVTANKNMKRKKKMNEEDNNNKKKEVDDPNRRLKKSKTWASKDFDGSDKWSRWGDDDWSRHDDHWNDDDDTWGDDWHRWSGKGSKSKSGKSSDQCKVILTNLSYHQAFSELFVMTADKSVTDDRPVFEFGKSASDALAEIAQEANADELFRYYRGRSGVEKVMIIDDFGEEDNYLAGGGIQKFWIDASQAEYLTIVAGLPFTNDGIVALEAGEIYDGAVYYLPAIDIGVEMNVQTCWSVHADEDDFQQYAFRSSCADEDSKFSDANLNDLPGEGFVMMHRGMQDLDSPKNAIADFFYLPECKELFGRGENFAQYFYLNQYDDDDLLFYPNGDWLDDVAFLNNLDTLQDDKYDTVLFNLARNSQDFEDFCDEIDEINDEFDNALTFLEPVLFDWRINIAKVEIDCSSGGWGSSSADSWSGGSW